MAPRLKCVTPGGTLPQTNFICERHTKFETYFSSSQQDPLRFNPREFVFCLIAIQGMQSSG